MASEKLGHRAWPLGPRCRRRTTARRERGERTAKTRRLRPTELFSILALLPFLSLLSVHLLLFMGETALSDGPVLFIRAN